AATAGDEGRPHAGPTHEDVKKAAAERTEAAATLKDKRKELHEERKSGDADAAAETKGELKDARKDLKEAWEKLRETRKDRRKEHREALQKKWGDLPKRPAVKAELKVHAWRVARLKRIRAVADNQGKKDAVSRVDKLLEKENTRHQKHMEKLQSKGGEE
ncbi:MAG: hypothetical protein U0263_21045, partial [Polyangiaceae bacterium]